MKTRVLACVCGVLAAWPLRGATAQSPILTPRDSALHALNRLAYGPRPGEVDRVAAAGAKQVRGPPDRDGQEPRDAVLPGQLGERGPWLDAAASHAAACPAAVRPAPDVRPPAAVRSGAGSDARRLAAPAGRRAHAEGHQRELRA